MPEQSNFDLGSALLSSLPEILVAALVALITAYLTGRNERARLREELKLEYSVEVAIRRLLGEQGWDLREFKSIQHHFEGMDEKRLREHLVRAGAISFRDKDGKEKWGLLERNIHRLAKKD